MATTYDKIATTTLSTSATTITFSSIAATYTDLRLVIVQIGTYQDLQIQLNGDTATNYSMTQLSGNGTAAASSRQTSVAQYDCSGGTAGTSGTSYPLFSTIDFFSYAGSTYKTMLSTKSLDMNGSGVTVRTVGLWRNTAAITSILLLLNNADNVGTTATLYGILKA
jgi:hypothetical protein